jgi:hypothetical protein
VCDQCFQRIVVRQHYSLPSHSLIFPFIVPFSPTSPPLRPPFAQDEFAQGNIGSQGNLDSDLGDVLSGVDYLMGLSHEPTGSDEHRFGCVHPEAEVGIFGGSYGGYMTLRALSVVPDRFTAGVAMYGFLMNRWMTFEGGDMTWETEYIGDPNRWPLTDDMQQHDVFDKLANIASPVLFIHGEADDICPLSQSFVAFRVLQVCVSMCVDVCEGSCIWGKCVNARMDQ